MAHHGSESSSLRQLLDRQFEQGGARTLEEFAKAARDPEAFEKAGATGRFPEGKLTAEDQGEIAVAIAVRGGKIVLHFGDQPVTWVGLTADQAEGFAGVLLDRAKKLREVG